MKYCVSDLHGEYGLFCKLLEKLRFSERDEMIVCGDILDKGEESIRLLKLIFSMPNVRCILGNHEYQFLKFYWSLMEGSPEDFDVVLAKLRGYVGADGHLLQWEDMDKLEQLPFYIEEDGCLFVHAGVPLTENKKILPLEGVSAEEFVYDRTFKEPSVLPNDRRCVVFGHTPTHYIDGKREILLYPRVESPVSMSDYYKVHLDMGVYLTGIIGCFCMDSMERIYVER